MDALALRRIRAHDGPVIVHVGPGSRFPGVHGGRKIGKGELHVCIEPDAEQSGLIRDMSETFEHIRDQVVVIPKSAQLSHFPAGRADEIHIHNLFTQPSIKPQARQIIALAFRWLKPGGRILVGHTLVPPVAPLGFVQDLARRHDLSVHVLARDPNEVHDFRQMRTMAPPERERNILEQHMGVEPTGTVHAGYFLAELRKKA